MMRNMLVLSAWLLSSALLAQAPSVAPSEEKGTYLGVLFSPIPEVLHDQLPQLPRNQGVLITHVLPDSPGAQADLRRHDILLQYQDEKVRDCEHLARLIQNDQPDRKVKLVLLRGGREKTVEVVLGLGPVLRIASGEKGAGPRPGDVVRGASKPGLTAAVSVSATPLEQGKMKVAIEYYQDGTGRLKTLTCEGTDTAIDSEVQKLPDKERGLVQAALQRIRRLNLQGVTPLPSPQGR
jgi:hypothetical protein